MEITEDKVKEAIASILERSLLRIRELARNSDFKAIDVEAYHVHNLPAKLINPLHLPSLKYYREIECVDYLAHSASAAAQWFKTDWEIIDAYLKQHADNPKR